MSDKYRKEIAQFLTTNLVEWQEKAILIPWDGVEYIAEEIINHVIIHEIHHIGQFSVWARELGLAPVPTHFVGRKLNSIYSY